MEFSYNTYVLKINLFEYIYKCYIDYDLLIFYTDSLGYFVWICVSNIQYDYGLTFFFVMRS